MDNSQPYEPPAENPRAERAPSFHHAPRDLVEDYWDPERLGDRSGAGVRTARLVQSLRRVAAARDPMAALVESAVRRHNGASDAMTTALADLAVTGRTAFARFRAAPPSESSLHAALTRALRERGRGEPDPRALNHAVGRTLDRAYQVAWALVAEGDRRQELREGLGWVAVSGEDDAPHVPVNLPCTRDAMGELHVRVPGLSQTMICRAGIKIPGAPLPGQARPAQWRSLPPDIERNFQRLIGADRYNYYDELALFIHGLGSRLEESDGFKRELIATMGRRGVRLAVLSVDLPGFGYSSRIAMDAFLRETLGGAWHGFALPDGRGSNFPLLTLFRDVIALIQRQIRGGIQYAMGGSLGGNLSLYLAESPVRPFTRLSGGAEMVNVRKFASWSPGSAWESYQRSTNNPFEAVGNNGIDFDVARPDRSIAKHGATTRSRARMVEPEDPRSRFRFFELMHRGEELPPPLSRGGAWGYPPEMPNLLTQAELYGPDYRRTFWTCAYEQVTFSHQEAFGLGQWRFQTINRPLLIAAGAGDRGTSDLMNIYDNVRKLTDHSPAVPGKRLLMLATGHSISDERPQHLAREVADFLVALDHGVLAATSWGRDRYDLFTHDARGEVLQLWYAGRWTWSRLGNGFANGERFCGLLAATSWGRDRIDVFGIGRRGTILQLWWGPGWNWTDLSERFPSAFPPNLRLSGPVAAASPAPGRIEIFATTDAGEVWRFWFDGGWRSESMGNRFPGGGERFVGQIAAMSWAVDRIDVFGLGTRGQILQLWRAGGEGAGWNWSDLTATFPPQHVDMLSIAGVATGAGRIDLFGRSRSGHVMRMHHQNGRWAWERIPGAFRTNVQRADHCGPATFDDHLSVASWGERRIDVFGFAETGNIFQMWRNSDSEGWGRADLDNGWIRRRETSASSIIVDIVVGADGTDTNLTRHTPSNVNAIVRLRGRPEVRRDLSQRQPWTPHTLYRREIPLPAGVRLQDIETFSIETDISGRRFLDADNWTMQGLQVSFVNGRETGALLRVCGNPLARFDIDNRRRDWAITLP
jgi:hypothetical protein